MAERIAFYHAALFSPALSTWCKAIDSGFLTTWPQLTSAQVRKHPPQSIPMQQGHLDQQRANLRSTTVTIRDTSVPATRASSSTAPRTRSHHIFADIQPATGRIYADQTGRFIVPSSLGNNYMLILYDQDSNYIHVEPMSSRSGKDILAAYKKGFALFTSRGLTPLLQQLDNEASTVLQQFLRDQDVDFQLVPPNVHQQNAAERAFRTFKNHMIAGLCGTDPNFPLHLWD